MQKKYQSVDDFGEDSVLQVGDVVKFPFEEEEISHVVEKQGIFLVLTITKGATKIIFIENYLEDLTFRVFEEIFIQEKYLQLNPI